MTHFKFVLISFSAFSAWGVFTISEEKQTHPAEFLFSILLTANSNTFAANSIITISWKVLLLVILSWCSAFIFFKHLYLLNCKVSFSRWECHSQIPSVFSLGELTLIFIDICKIFLSIFRTKTFYPNGTNLTISQVLPSSQMLQS